MRISTFITSTILLGATNMASAQTQPSFVDPSFGGPINSITAPAGYVPIPTWDPYLLKREKMAKANPRYLVDFYTLQTGKDLIADALQLVADPANPASNRKVFKMTLDRSDKDVWGWRTEVGPVAELANAGTVRWYAISMLFPSSWIAHPESTVVAQLHTHQRALAVSPPVALVINNNDLNLEIRANHRLPSDDPSSLVEPLTPVADPASSANTAHQMFRLTKVQYEKWYCFVIRADWSYTPGAGALKVWMNGKVAYDAKNLHIGYKSFLGNYPKTGLYWPKTGTDSLTNLSIYTDFIHLGSERSINDETAVYEEMAAKTPCSQ